MIPEDAEASGGGKDLAQLLFLLDEKSRALLWNLWWHRHAGISELRSSIGASTDFDVLYRMREVINPAAEMLWGKPVVSFEQAKIDSLTGEKVLFSWWLLDTGPLAPFRARWPLVDVLEERDEVTVIAQLPAPVNLCQTDMKLRNGVLKVSLQKQEEQAGHANQG